VGGQPPQVVVCGRTWGGVDTAYRVYSSVGTGCKPLLCPEALRPRAETCQVLDVSPSLLLLARALPSRLHLPEGAASEDFVFHVVCDIGVIEAANLLKACGDATKGVFQSRRVRLPSPV